MAIKDLDVNYDKLDDKLANWTPKMRRPSAGYLLMIQDVLRKEKIKKLLEKVK
jgi:hypothetical protein